MLGPSASPNLDPIVQVCQVQFMRMDLLKALQLLSLVRIAMPM